MYYSHHFPPNSIQADQFLGISTTGWSGLSAVATFLAVVVAVSMPLLVLWFNSRPKRSKLVFEDARVIPQKTSGEEDPMEGSNLHVGRIIVTNKGKHKASMVEAYLEEIHWDDGSREDFFPIPLVWTHGQLNRHGLTVRDIYPNQTAYLDVIRHVVDAAFVGERAVLFAVAAGHGVDHLSRVNYGSSKVRIKFFQESGQVDSVWIHIRWKQPEVPELVITKEV